MDGAAGAGERGEPARRSASNAPRRVDIWAMTSGISEVSGSRSRSSRIPAAYSVATVCWHSSRVPTRPAAISASARSPGSPESRACASAAVRPGDAGRHTALLPDAPRSRSTSVCNGAGPKTGTPPADRIAASTSAVGASTETSCPPARRLLNAAMLAAVAAPPRSQISSTGSRACSSVSLTTHPTRMPATSASLGRAKPAATQIACQPALAASIAMGGSEFAWRGNRRPSCS